MPSTPDCIRCKGKMEPGFVLDRGDHNMRNTQEWAEGAPERSYWRGLKLKGKEMYQVRSFRCTRCGYLESYATTE